MHTLYAKQISTMLYSLMLFRSFSQLTLSRPKGPSSRKRPRRFSAPPPTTSAAGDSDSKPAPDATKRHSHNVLETWLSSIETGQLPQDEEQQQQPSSSSVEDAEALRDSRRGSKESGSIADSHILKDSRRTSKESNFVEGSHILKDSRSSENSHILRDSRRSSKESSSLEDSHILRGSRRDSKDSGSMENSPVLRGSRRSSRGSGSIEGPQAVKHSRRSSREGSVSKDSDEKLSSSLIQDPSAVADSTPLTGSTSMPHPHADSTPLGSIPSMEVRRLPQIKGGMRLPQLDLTSLAPEQNQVVSGVQKGWSEGGGAEGGATEDKEKESTDNIKDLSRKIHGK